MDFQLKKEQSKKMVNYPSPLNRRLSKYLALPPPKEFKCPLVNGIELIIAVKNNPPINYNLRY